MSDPEKNPFEKAAESADQSLGAELIAWLRQNRKWWLIPLILTVGLIGVLTLLASTGAAPFLYTLW